MGFGAIGTNKVPNSCCVRVPKLALTTQDEIAMMWKTGLGNLPVIRNVNHVAGRNRNELRRHDGTVNGTRGRRSGLLRGHIHSPAARSQGHGDCQQENSEQGAVHSMDDGLLTWSIVERPSNLRGAAL